MCLLANRVQAKTAHKMLHRAHLFLGRQVPHKPGRVSLAHIGLLVIAKDAQKIVHKDLLHVRKINFFAAFPFQ